MESNSLVHHWHFSSPALEYLTGQTKFEALSSLETTLGSIVLTNRPHKRDASIKALLARHDLGGLCNTLIKQPSGAEQRTLAALLICAQEEERSRIARELHDDIAQQLALISIDIDRMRSSAPHNEDVNRLDTLEKRVRNLGLHVRTLSHELHSPELDILGLGSAISVFCREFGSAHNIEVACDCSGLPKGLPNDISLCLYRITQEALQNVAKHSGARKALVELRVDDSGVTLRIQDFGSGFHMNGVGWSSRVGLRSMFERIRSVGGTIVIRSKPGEGTTIEARVGYPCYN